MFSRTTFTLTLIGFVLPGFSLEIKKKHVEQKKKQKPVRVVKFNLFSAIDRPRNYPTNTRKAYKSMAKPTQICTKSARLRATLLNA